MRHRRRVFAWLTLLVLALTSATAGTDSFRLSPDHTQWPPEVFYSAYKLITSEAELTALDTLQGPDRALFLKRFWKRRDPSPADLPNEFRDQFRDRVEIALIRFRTVNILDPWDERGKLYIKFGEPDERQKRVDNWYEPKDSEKIARGAPDVNQHKLDYGELWFYFGRNLKLQFQGYNSSYEMVPVVSAQGEYQPNFEFYEKRIQIDTSQVAYVPPLGQLELDMSLAWYPFRRDDGSYDVYICSVFPVSAMAQSTGLRESQLNYSVSITVFDSALYVAADHTTGGSRSFYGKTRGLLAQNDWGYVLPPGYYIIGCEARSGDLTYHAATSFDGWLVPYADSVDLDLSPLVIAADVRPATDPSTHFIRNGKEIVPMPNATFRKGQDVAFYHELYNLRPDESGRCLYQIAYTLYDQKRETQQMIYSEELASLKTDTYQAGRIPGRQLQKGEYILEVKTKDLVAGSERTALASLQVK